MSQQQSAARAVQWWENEFDELSFDDTPADLIYLLFFNHLKSDACKLDGRKARSLMAGIALALRRELRYLDMDMNNFVKGIQASLPKSGGKKAMEAWRLAAPELPS